MTTDELDRILGSDELLAPSAGFAAAVMDRVGQDASQPAPLRFPWGRFLAGLLACGAVAASGTVLLLRNTTILVELFAPLAEVAPLLAWAAFSVLAAFGATRLPRLIRL